MGSWTCLSNIVEIQGKCRPGYEVHEREALVLGGLDILELKQRVEVEAHGTALCGGHEMVDIDHPITVKPDLDPCWMWICIHLMCARIEEVPDDEGYLEDEEQEVTLAHLLLMRQGRDHVKMI